MTDSIVEDWASEPDMWLRRAVVVCQVGARGDTDARRLFRFCAQLAPEAVARFVSDHTESLPSLSIREATKHIGHLVSV